MTSDPATPIWHSGSSWHTI